MLLIKHTFTVEVDPSTVTDPDCEALVDELDTITDTMEELFIASVQGLASRTGFALTPGTVD